jgi:cation transport ATPase
VKQSIDEAMRICQYAIVAATLLVAFMVVSWFAHFGDPQYKWYFWMGQWLLLGLAVYFGYVFGKHRARTKAITENVTM